MSELSEQQQTELVQAAQVAGARDDNFSRLLADAFAEAERLQTLESEGDGKRLTVTRRDGIV